MILITGAGGKTGRSLIKALSKVESICALVRGEEHVSVVKSLGADKVIIGDVHDQIGIRSVMQGVRAVYHICPNMDPDEIAVGNLIIREACEAGVEHLVYHSVLHPQAERMTHHWQKMRVEEMIFESRLPFTILQPALYMQNLLASWKSIVKDGVLHVPYSIDSKFSFVDLEDVAEVAKIVLTQPDHLNAIYELVGTPPMSHVDVAEICGRVLNRDVRAEKEEIGRFAGRVRAERSERSLRAKSKRAPAMGQYAIENLVRMFEYYDQWGLVGNSNVLMWLLKREPNSLESFVQRTIKDQDVI